MAKDEFGGVAIQDAAKDDFGGIAVAEPPASATPKPQAAPVGPNAARNRRQANLNSGLTPEQAQARREAVTGAINAYPGFTQIEEGVGQLGTSGERKKGLHNVFVGTGKFATAPVLVGGAATAGIPATATALGAGLVAAPVAEKLATMAGAEPDTAALVGDAAAVGAGAVAGGVPRVGNTLRGAAAGLEKVTEGTGVMNRIGNALSGAWQNAKAAWNKPNPIYTPSNPRPAPAYAGSPQPVPAPVPSAEPIASDLTSGRKVPTAEERIARANAPQAAAGPKKAPSAAPAGPSQADLDAAARALGAKNYAAVTDPGQKAAVEGIAKKLSERQAAKPIPAPVGPVQAAPAEPSPVAVEPPASQPDAKPVATPRSEADLARATAQDLVNKGVTVDQLLAMPESQRTEALGDDAHRFGDIVREMRSHVSGAKMDAARDAKDAAMARFFSAKNISPEDVEGMDEGTLATHIKSAGYRPPGKSGALGRSHIQIQQDIADQMRSGATPSPGSSAPQPQVPAADAIPLSDEVSSQRKQYFKSMPVVGVTEGDSNAGPGGRIRQVPIADLTPTQDVTETSSGMKARDVERYREMLRSGSEPPPLAGRYDPDTGKVELSEGHRRLEALKAEGRDSAPVVIGGLGEYASAQGSPGVTSGVQAVVRTPAGTKAKVQYRISEADDLKTSFDPDYNTDIGHQPRDTSRIGSRQRVEQRMRDMDPEAMGPSRMAGDGAPITKEGNAVTRNHGTEALKENYARDNGKAREYRDWVTENAGLAGMTPEQVGAMKNPILHRDLVEDWDHPKIKQFADEANQSSVARMSDAELAKQMGEGMSGAKMDAFNPNDDGVPNAEFVRGMIKDFPAEEQAQFFDRHGEVSQNGARLIRNAVFAKAYNNTAAIERMAEATDSQVRNITTGMLKAAAPAAKLNESIARGDSYPLSISDEVGKAVEVIDRLRSEKKTVSDWMKQGDLLGRDPVVHDLVSILAAESRRPNLIRDVLKGYVEGVVRLGSPKQQGIFGPVEPPSKMELLEDSYARAKAASAAKESANGQASLLGSQ